MMLSIVTPAFNEEANLPVLYRRIESALRGIEWEWIVVDDHSADGTFAVVSALARSDTRVRAIRLSRNCGSHSAIFCGLHHAQGDAAAMLAADLQDPPEALLDLVVRWREGAQVVWAINTEGAITSRAYHWLMRRTDAATSASVRFFVIDRKVIEAVRQFGEQHTSLFALVAWMGFRQATAECSRHARINGRSGWTLRKKIALAVDSITAFSYAPIRMMTYLGFATALLGFLYAAVIVVRAIGGVPVQGWPSLMVAVLVLAGVQMLMMGVLGEYVWRGLEEARRRPRYLVEESTRPLAQAEVVPR